ncbi:hypothetical protein MASR2M50_10480 [Thauera sp.]
MPNATTPTARPPRGEFRVNTATSGAQYEPAVAMLEGGGFVVTWRSDNQDGSGAGVYAQRYAADGSALGGEFRVNESIDGSQYQPDVTALAGRRLRRHLAQRQLRRLR